MESRFTVINDTTAEWNKYNPVLYAGEAGFELLENGKWAVKFGDGVSHWRELPYVVNFSQNDDLMQEQVDLATALANRADAAAERAGAIANSIPPSYDDLAQLVQEIAIKPTASGTIAHTEDSADAPIQGLVIYGSSTQDGTPSPNNYVPIVSVGDSGSLAISACGKNLVKERAVNYNYKLFAICPPGIYTLSFDVIEDVETYTVYFHDSQDVYEFPQHLAFHDLKAGQRVSKSINITHESGVLYVKFWSSCSKFTNVQFEAGGRATQYEPPRLQTAALTTGLPLQSYENIHDELRVFSDGTGEIIKRFCTLIFDGTENVNYLVHSSGNKVAIIRAERLAFDASKICWLCSHFSPYAYGYASPKFPENVVSFASLKKDIYFNVPDTITTANEFKEFLAEQYNAGTPVTMVYAMETPETIPLTTAEVQDVLALRTHKPVTNITANGAEIAVSYIADTKTYIDQKIENLFAAISEQNMGGI